jgi:hypothetical protein
MTNPQLLGQSAWNQRARKHRRSKSSSGTTRTAKAESNEKVSGQSRELLWITETAEARALR